MISSTIQLLICPLIWLAVWTPAASQGEYKHFPQLGWCLAAQRLTHWASCWLLPTMASSRSRRYCLQLPRQGPARELQWTKCVTFQPPRFVSWISFFTMALSIRASICPPGQHGDAEQLEWRLQWLFPPQVLRGSVPPRPQQHRALPGLHQDFHQALWFHPDHWIRHGQAWQGRTQGRRWNGGVQDLGCPGAPPSLGVRSVSPREGSVRATPAANKSEMCIFMALPLWGDGRGAASSSLGALCGWLAAGGTSGLQQGRARLALLSNLGGGPNAEARGTVDWSCLSLIHWLLLCGTASGAGFPEVKAYAPRPSRPAGAPDVTSGGGSGVCTFAGHVRPGQLVSGVVYGLSGSGVWRGSAREHRPGLRRVRARDEGGAVGRRDC